MPKTNESIDYKTLLKEAKKLAQENELQKAEEILQSIISQDKSTDEAYYVLSQIENKKNNKEQAIQHLIKAIELNTIEFYFMEIAKLFSDISRYDQAIDCYRQILNTNPQNTIATINTSICHTKQGLHQEALDYAKKALELDDKNADAYCAMAVALNSLGKTQEAVETYKTCLSIDPKHLNATTNLAVILSTEFCDFEQSIEYRKKALEIDQNHHQSLLNLGLYNLLLKNFKEGFKYFNKSKYQKTTILTKKPRWQGESLKDKVIYVYREQGVGDTIQLVRFLPLLKKFNPKRILFKAHEAITSVLKMSCNDIEIIDASTSDSHIEYDVFTTLFEVPEFLGLEYKDLEKTNKYLRTDYNKVILYKQKFFNNTDFKIGIFWQGNPEHQKDNLRSMKLEQFSKLLDLENTKIYSLQKGYGIEQLESYPRKDEITNLGRYFYDFSDTAAAIENLDLVITIDSATAHLAGALGKDVWMILPTNYEWRWFKDMNKTIWYSSMRLFRPKKNQNKAEIIDKMYKLLDDKITKTRI